MTNGHAIHAGIVACETDPRTGKLARTPEPFHGAAEVTVGQRLNGEARRVCGDCLRRHHSAMRVLSHRVVFPFTSKN